MVQPPTSLFAQDPQAFMAIVANDDPEVRVNSLHTWDDMVVCETLRYGFSNDTSRVRELVQFYEQLVMPAPVERRNEVYAPIAQIVRWQGGNTVGALTPFMFVDTDIGIVSTATLDYVSIGSIADNDPMLRPRDVIDIVKNGVPRNPSAVIGGLLAAGDPRVCELVEPLRHGLDEEQARVVSVCFSGLTTKCVVEFYLDWLDELVDREDWVGQATLGHVMAGLYRLAAHRQVPMIADGLRPFPYDPDEAQTSISWIDPDVFALSIADRLYDLELRETYPKGMPHVMQALGLVPKSSPSEWMDLAVYSDLSHTRN